MQVETSAPWLWHVPHQRWQFQLIFSLLSLFTTLRQDHVPRCLIVTSRVHAWQQYLHRVIHAHDIDDNAMELMERLFFVSWHSNGRSFLETCDDLVMHFASIRALARGPRKERHPNKKNASPEKSILLIIDELPTLERLLLKKKHQWQRQARLAHYALELKRYQALQYLKDVVTLTKTMVLVVTRQLFHLEKMLGRTMHESPLNAPDFSVDSKLITLPQWTRLLSRWFFVLGHDASSLPSRKIVVLTHVPPSSREERPHSKLTFEKRYFDVRSRIRHAEEKKNVFDAIARYWWSLLAK